MGAVRTPVVATALLLLAGCAWATDDRASTETPAAPASSRVASPSARPSVGLPSDVDTRPSPRTTGPDRCDEEVLAARTVHLRGSRGSVRWDLAVPEFSGAPSAAEVNRRVRASAQDAIDQGLREGRDDDGVRRTVTGTGEVTTNDRRTVQVELWWDDFRTDTPHGSWNVATTAVTTDEGRPILLREVLADVPSALRELGAAVEEQAAAEGEDVTDPDGLAPSLTNFAAWQTTGEGMRFSFQDHQLGGHGQRSYTVPWSRVRPLLSDEGAGLLDPDVDPTTC